MRPQSAARPANPIKETLENPLSLGEGLEGAGVAGQGMVGKERQLGFGELERGNVKKQTRRETFLAEMEAVAPFSLLVGLLEPFYLPVGPHKGEGRPIRWR